MTITVPKWATTLVAGAIVGTVAAIDHFTGWDLDPETVALILGGLGLPQVAELVRKFGVETDGK